jgi:mycofactocin precursor
LTEGGPELREKHEKELEVRNEKEEREDILEEIEVEDLTVDGICGVY